MDEKNHRAGFAAIVGRPNVGKSTLLNRLLGQKLAAVTPKPQTTRDRILGVKDVPGAQIVFVDTPGLHRARSPLNQYMVGEAQGAVGDADVVILVVEAPRTAPAVLAGVPFDPGAGVTAILEDLRRVESPRILGLNKIDLLPDKSALLPLLDGYGQLGLFAEIIPISAQSGDGLDRLEAAVAARLPEGPALFPPDVVTDRAERFLAGELVREQATILLGDELPYSLAVTVAVWEERKTQGDVVIDATIHVERESQKPIVIGERGRMIKEIGSRARAEITRLLGRPAHLRLTVVVTPDWTRETRSLRRLGYSQSS